MKGILALLLIGVVSFGWGQSFSWYPNDTISTDLNPNLEVEMKMNQVNLTGDTLELGIEVVYNDIPGSWDGMVCIYGLCLGHIPSVGFTWNQSPVWGTDSAYVRLTANPMGGTEPCMLRIRVHNLNHPFDTDTATWILNSSYLTAEDYMLGENKVKLFPNPSKNELNIESKFEFDEIRIVDYSGRVIEERKVIATETLKINTSAYRKGSYMIMAYQKGTQILKSSFIKN